MSVTKERLEKIIQQIKGLQQEREKLIEENQSLKDALHSLRQTVEKDNDKANNVTDSKLLAKQIDSYVVEIDECLKMLNEVQS